MKKINSFNGIKLAIIGAAVAAAGVAFAAPSEAPQRFQGGEHPGAHQGHHGHFPHQAHPGAHGKAGCPGMSHHAKGKHGHRHGDMHRAGLVIPGYGFVSQDFVDGMGLNESQLKLVEEARTASKTLRENRRDSFKQLRDARKERLNAPFDPEQALKHAAEQREKAMAERRQIDEKWIAVWKALDQNQQTRIAAHMKDRAEKAEQREERREKRQPSGAEATPKSST